MFISRMSKGSWGKIRAFFDVTTSEGFTIKGFKLVEGINGLFVGFPSEKKDSEYKDTVWAERDVKDSLTEIAVNVYESKEGVASQGNYIPEEVSRELNEEQGF